MGRQILVALENPDRIDHFLPYMDQVAQEDTKLVLLVYHQDGESTLLLDQLRTLHTGFLPEPVFKNSSITAHRRQAAEQRIFPACQALRQRGVEIAVKLYSTPVRKVINEYVRKSDVEMVIMHPARGARRSRTLLRRLSSSFHNFRSQDFDGVLLIHPSGTVKA